jgi:hypothetical protein
MNDKSNRKIATASGTDARSRPTTLRLITQQELQPTPTHPAKTALQGPTKQSFHPDNNDDDPGPAAA